MPESDLRHIIPVPEALSVPNGLAACFFESPRNPHSGCFVLSRTQMDYWTKQPHWQDGDCSCIPLESAATLGIAKLSNYSSR